MDILQSIVLGIVEGVTEFLPISSTGHLILTSEILGIQQTDFVKTFEISVQSGAILAVIFLYCLPAGRQGRNLMKVDLDLLKKIMVAFLPTAVIGFVVYKIVKEYLLGNSEVVLASLFIGGILLIAVEMIFKNKPKNEELRTKTQISYTQAFIVGLFQAIAVIPGVSRSASTIVGGMLIGIDRRTATEFSFLVAIPTILAATALDLTETNPFTLSSYELTTLLVGFVVTFITALIAVKWLVKYVEKHTFIPFGIYRIALALLYFFLILE